MLLATYYSEILNTRAYMGVISQLWILPNVIALLTVPDSINAWSKFAILTVLLSFPSGESISMHFASTQTKDIVHAMHVGWCSRNSNTVRTRTVSAALYKLVICLSVRTCLEEWANNSSMFVQVGGIVVANIYQEKDRPLCKYCIAFDLSINTDK